MPAQDENGRSEPSSEIGLILIVEDDPLMQKVLKRIFAGENYAVEIAGDGQTGIELFSSHRPMAVLLDLILPRVSGRELCQEIKSRAPETPVVVLSAINEVNNKVLLLEIGADDYVTKPFSPRELLARVQAAIKRRAPLARSFIARFGECEIDFDKMTATRAGESVILTSPEFRLVRFFIENPGRVLSRELLLNQVWGYNAYPTTRTVDNQILKLRQRLERDPGNPKHFLTVFGTGYKFVRN